MPEFGTILLIVGVALMFGGSFMYPRALDHLRPEFRGKRDMVLYWATYRYTPAGKRLLRQAWATQLCGVGLLLLATLL